jgi:cyanophycinase
MRRALAALLLLSAVPANAALTRYFSGSARDVSPPLHGPALILAGGGTDVEPALQAAIDTVRGCETCNTGIDVAVLRASGADGYNPLFMGLRGVSSVVTFVITDRASAERRDVARTVRRAELVFFAGGDQCNYVRWIKGTRTARAVESVYARGGAIGGTSAGLAILGDVIYDACPDQSAQSKDVLLDPYSVDVSLSRDFFHWRFLEATITDTHFKQRDRMGRLLVFLARTLQDRGMSSVGGIGVSERTTLLVKGDGKAVVMGEGPVYLIRADHPPELCERARPLTYSAFKVWRFGTSESIDLARPPTEGFTTLDVVDGKLTRDPY